MAHRASALHGAVDESGRGMTPDQMEAEAVASARERLTAKYADELDDIFRRLCVERGLDLVTVRRTIYKRVSQTEALTLVCHGWEVIEEDSL